MKTQSNKLAYLLNLLWRSPVFGNSYPLATHKNFNMLQMDMIYPCFLQTMIPILEEGTPDLSLSEAESIIGQIAPKSIAFCASISAGEIEDTKPLCTAAVSIAISYWADQCMDRGDEAMLAAVQYLNHKDISTISPSSALLASRLKALRYIGQLASKITQSPQDLPYVRQAIERDVLGNQAEMRVLSRKYSKSQPDDFWNTYSQETVQKIIDGSGLMSAVAIIYAIYRQNDPRLPSLDEIYYHTEMMRLVHGPFNAAVRVFDDAGDWLIDTGQDKSWGVFNINVFNEAHPIFIQAFLDYSCLQEDNPMRTEALSAFALPVSERRLVISHLYLNYVRQQTNQLPPSLWKRYEVFLTLAKRTLEAGFVNAIGDMFLSENTDLSALETDLVKLITPDADSSLFEKETNL